MENIQGIIFRENVMNTYAAALWGTMFLLLMAGSRLPEKSMDVTDLRRTALAGQ